MIERPIRILLVEDNPADARLVRALLEDAGIPHRLDLAGRSAEAAGMLLSDPADCVLLDLNLPDSKGLETIRRVADAGPRVPIVVLSGMRDERLAIQALQAGAQDYLIKGEFDEQSLRRSLRYAIERKRIEERLKESERRLLEAQRIAGMGSWRWDVASDTVVWDDELLGIYGLAREAFAGTFEAFLERLPEEDHPRVREVISRALETREPFDFEHRIVRPDGTLRTLQARGKVLTDGSGRVTAMVGTGQDVTVRKEADRELEEARRRLSVTEKLSALGTLVSGIAHEIRTPSTYVTTNLYLLRRRLDSALAGRPELADVTAHALRYVDAALDGIGRIDRLLTQLRQFVKGEGPDRREMSLDEVVRGAIELFRGTQSAGCEILLDLRPTPAVRLDRAQVEQVLLNLLNNAVDAMPEGGPIWVRTRSDGKTAEIEVEDQGTGLSPEAEARLYDPFFTTKPEGTGLGLSISRRILESHQGDLRYDTRRGKGTRFVVVLPVAAADASGVDA